MDMNITTIKELRTGHPRLLRCRIRDAGEHGRIRYVELEQFALWEHFMRSRHAIHVHEIELCLWLDKDEYANSAAVFEHAGQIDAVHHIEINVYDPRYHFSMNVGRYADANDAPFLADLLLQHAQRNSNSDMCSVQITEGRCVRVGKISDRRNLLMGLSYGTGRAQRNPGVMRAAS